MSDLTDPQVEAACEAFWESWPLEGFGPEWTEAARRNMANALRAAVSIPADPPATPLETAHEYDVLRPPADPPDDAQIEAVTLAIFDRLSAAVGWADCRDAAVAALAAASLSADPTDDTYEALDNANKALVAEVARLRAALTALLDEVETQDSAYVMQHSVAADQARTALGAADPETPMTIYPGSPTDTIDSLRREVARLRAALGEILATIDAAIRSPAADPETP